MSRYFALVFVLLATLATVAIGQEPAGSASANDVQALSQAAYDQCHAEREARLTKTQSEHPESVPLMRSLFSESYCSCAKQGIESQLQPGTIGKLSRPELRQRIVPIYQRCALANFQRELPSMCKVWYRGLFPENERITDAQQTSACTCMAQATATLRPEELQEVASQTVQDYQDWRENPAARFVAARPKSILGSLGRCAREEGLLR